MFSGGIDKLHRAVMGKDFFLQVIKVMLFNISLESI